MSNVLVATLVYNLLLDAGLFGTLRCRSEGTFSPPDQPLVVRAEQVVVFSPVDEGTTGIVAEDEVDAVVISLVERGREREVRVAPQ